MTFDLTRQELEYVLNVLAQRPYAEVRLVIDKITEQANQPKEQDNGTSLNSN